jgi:hypothetical protein
MNTTYTFLYADGSVKRTVSYGFKTALIGTQFMYTAKFKVNTLKANFIDEYLVGRLADNLVARSGNADKRGNYTVHYVLTTTNSAERDVLWQALKYAEAFALRKQADVAELKAQGYHAVEEYERQQNYAWQAQVQADDLPF